MSLDPENSAPFRSRLLWAGAVVIALGVTLAVQQTRSTDRQMRSDLLHHATLLSWAVNADHVAALTGTPADMDSVVYQRIHGQLQKAHGLYPWLKFIYIMRKDAAGHILFLADSEPADSPGFSPPGQPYEEATPLLHSTFDAGHQATEGPTSDRWGTWVSALVPLFHPTDDRVVGVLGMDVDARLWKSRVLRSGLPPLAFTGLLLFLLTLTHLRLNQVRHRHHATWLGPEVQMTATLGLALTAFVVYLAQSHESQSRRDAFRRLAGSQVSLLQHSMFRIGDHYLESVARFFSSSDFVDQEEFAHFTAFLLNRPYAEFWSWIPAVNREDQGTFEQAVRAAGRPDFTIHDFPGQKRFDAAQHYPVCYIAPSNTYDYFLGFDQGSEEVRLAALNRAIRERMATATGPLPSSHPNGGTEITIYRPVFAVDDPDRLSGFASVTLDADLLLRRALSRESTRSETANPVSLYFVSGDNPPQRIATTDSEQAPDIRQATNPLVSRQPLPTMAVPVLAFGNVYAFVIHPGASFDLLYPAVAVRNTSVIGLILTALLSALVNTLISRRAALEKMVADRTAELRASEQSYHGLFHAIQQAIYILDDQGRFLDVNDGALKMYGYTREELIGRSPASVSAPDRNRMSEVALALEKAQQGEPQYLEFWGQRKNGEAFPKDVWLYPGTYFGRAVVVAVATDISERKWAEQELRDTHERLNTFIKAIPDTVQIKDGQGRWKIINEAAARLFHVDEEEWRGRTESELAEARPAYRAMHEACELSDEAAWRSEGPYINTEVVKGPDGQERVYEVRKLALFEADGQRKTLIAIGRDVTERAQAEQEKERLRSQLQQAQKMESVGRLAGGVAHDFNNMLQAIMGNAALALDEAPSGPLSEYLQEILKSAQRSADLTRQLLAFASRQTISPRVIDLNDTISGMLKMLRRLIGEDIQLLWAPGSDLWPVKVDPSQIDQVMANLAVNARDAIGGVGTVTIETRNVTCAEHQPCTYSDCHPGDYVVLTVRDTGKGMDEETRTHIFEPFYTTKGPGKGVGLGLATLFGIVKQNRGFIDVQSEPGLGAMFTIGLPRSMVNPSREAQVGTTVPARGRNETLLLVEDEQAILRFGEESLHRLGYQVLIANSPERALDMARQHRGPIHLLITDVVLPTMNGRELAQLLSSITPDLKCLFMSGYTADIIAHRGVVDEKLNFIQKPFTVESLATKIRNVLDEPPAG